MKIVADYHNVISDYPKFFKFGNLYIVTASAKSKEKNIKRILKKNNIKYKEFHIFPHEWDDASSKFNSKLWKIRKIVKLKPDVFIDDDLTTILAVRRKLPNTFCLLAISDNYAKDEPEIKYTYSLKTGEYIGNL